MGDTKKQTPSKRRRRDSLSHRPSRETTPMKKKKSMHGGKVSDSPQQQRSVVDAGSAVTSTSPARLVGEEELVRVLHSRGNAHTTAEKLSLARTSICGGGRGRGRTVWSWLTTAMVGSATYVLKKSASDAKAGPVHNASTLWNNTETLVFHTEAWSLMVDIVDAVQSESGAQDGSDVDEIRAAGGNVQTIATCGLTPSLLVSLLPHQFLQTLVCCLRFLQHKLRSDSQQKQQNALHVGYLGRMVRALLHGEFSKDSTSFVPTIEQLCTFLEASLDASTVAMEGEGVCDDDTRNGLLSITSVGLSAWAVVVRREANRKKVFMVMVQRLLGPIARLRLLCKQCSTPTDTTAEVCATAGTVVTSSLFWPAHIDEYALAFTRPTPSEDASAPNIADDPLPPVENKKRKRKTKNTKETNDSASRPGGSYQKELFKTLKRLLSASAGDVDGTRDFLPVLMDGFATACHRHRIHGRNKRAHRGEARTEGGGDGDSDSDDARELEFGFFLELYHVLLERDDVSPSSSLLRSVNLLLRVVHAHRVHRRTRTAFSQRCTSTLAAMAAAVEGAIALCDDGAIAMLLGRLLLLQRIDHECVTTSLPAVVSVTCTRGYPAMGWAFLSSVMLAHAKMRQMEEMIKLLFAFQRKTDTLVLPTRDFLTTVSWCVRRLPLGQHRIIWNAFNDECAERSSHHSIRCLHQLFATYVDNVTIQTSNAKRIMLLMDATRERVVGDNPSPSAIALFVSISSAREICGRRMGVVPTVEGATLTPTLSDSAVLEALRQTALMPDVGGSLCTYAVRNLARLVQEGPSTTSGYGVHSGDIVHALVQNAVRWAQMEQLSPADCSIVSKVWGTILSNLGVLCECLRGHDEDRTLVLLFRAIVGAIASSSASPFPATTTAAELVKTSTATTTPDISCHIASLSFRCLFHNASFYENPSIRASLIRALFECVLDSAAPSSSSTSLSTPTLASVLLRCCEAAIDGKTSSSERGFDDDFTTVFTAKAASSKGQQRPAHPHRLRSVVSLFSYLPLHWFDFAHRNVLVSCVLLLDRMYGEQCALLSERCRYIVWAVVIGTPSQHILSRVASKSVLLHLVRLGDIRRADGACTDATRQCFVGCVRLLCRSGLNASTDSAAPPSATTGVDLVSSLIDTAAPTTADASLSLEQWDVVAGVAEGLSQAASASTSHRFLPSIGLLSAKLSHHAARNVDQWMKSGAATATAVDVAHIGCVETLSSLLRLLPHVPSLASDSYMDHIGRVLSMAVDAAAAHGPFSQSVHRFILAVCHSYNHLPRAFQRGRWSFARQLDIVLTLPESGARELLGALVDGATHEQVIHMADVVNGGDRSPAHTILCASVVLHSKHGTHALARSSKDVHSFVHSLSRVATCASAAQATEAVSLLVQMISSSKVFHLDARHTAAALHTVFGISDLGHTPLYQGLCRMLHSLITVRSTHIVSLLPAVIAATRALLMHIKSGDGSDGDGGGGKAAASRGFEPRFEHMSRVYTALSQVKRAVFQRHAVYALSDYLHLMQSCTLSAAERRCLLPGVFALMDVCDAREFQRLFRTLGPLPRALFRDLHTQYESGHRYSGKV